MQIPGKTVLSLFSYLTELTSVSQTQELTIQPHLRGLYVLIKLSQDLKKKKKVAKTIQNFLLLQIIPILD